MITIMPNDGWALVVNTRGKAYGEQPIDEAIQVQTFDKWSGEYKVKWAVKLCAIDLYKLVQDNERFILEICNNGHLVLIAIDGVGY